MGCGVYQLSYAKLRSTRLLAKDCYQQKRVTVRRRFAKRFTRISTAHWVKRRDVKPVVSSRSATFNPCAKAKALIRLTN